MSHTKYVFVVNNADGTGLQTDASNLGANDLGVFDNDAMGAVAALDAGDTFQLANSNYSSPRLRFDDIIKKGDVDGRAATKQVQTVTVALDSGRAEIKLIDVTDGREKFAIATFEAEASTANAAATALRAAINDSKRDVFKDVVASGSGASVVVTSPNNVILRVACNDASSVANTTDPILSIGTLQDVNAEYEDGLPFLGVTNIAGPNVVSLASGATGAKDVVNYDRACIVVKATEGDRVDLHELVIYFKQDNADVPANLGTIFGYSTSTTQT